MTREKRKETQTFDAVLYVGKFPPEQLQISIYQSTPQSTPQSDLVNLVQHYTESLNVIVKIRKRVIPMLTFQSPCESTYLEIHLLIQILRTLTTEVIENYGSTTLLLTAFLQSRASECPIQGWREALGFGGGEVSRCLSTRYISTYLPLAFLFLQCPLSPLPARERFKGGGDRFGDIYVHIVVQLQLDCSLAQDVPKNCTDMVSMAEQDSSDREVNEKKGTGKQQRSKYERKSVFQVRKTCWNLHDFS